MFERFFSDAVDAFWRFSIDTNIFFGTSSLVAKITGIVEECGNCVGILSDSNVLELPLTKEYLTSLGPLVAVTEFVGFESDLADIENAIAQLLQLVWEVGLLRWIC